MNFISKIPIFLISFLIVSCSPIYVMNIQNNSNEAVNVFVELRNTRFNANFRKEFEKSEMFYYKGIAKLTEFSADSLRNYLSKNHLMEKSYDFSTNLNYQFVLPPNILTNIDPSNGIEIYPFNKVYFFKDGTKCEIVPTIQDENCFVKVYKKEKTNTRKDKVDFFVIEKL